MIQKEEKKKILIRVDQKIIKNIQIFTHPK